MRPSAIVLALCAAQVAWTATGVPKKAIGRRVDQIEAHQRDGGPFRLCSEQSAAVLKELRDTTPPDAVIPVIGSARGDMEFAPALLWPRLCVFELDEAQRVRVPIRRFEDSDPAPIRLRGEGRRSLRLEPIPPQFR
ncbi:MAG: hypothetical protein AAF196_19510 [Planctomycetota bacterium]